MSSVSVGTPAGLDELGAHPRVLAEGLGGRVQHGIVGVDAAVAGHHRVGPAVEAEALVGVEAHELGDDDQRQVDGEVLDEVALPALGDLVDDLVGQLPHVVAELAHRAGREALVDQPALAGVLGVVHPDDRHRRGDARSDALGGAVALRVAADVAHVLVARHDPQLVARVPVHRALVAQPPVGVPGVVVEARVEDVDLHPPMLPNERSVGQGPRSAGAVTSNRARRPDVPAGCAHLDATGPAIDPPAVAIDVPTGEVAEADGEPGRRGLAGCEDEPREPAELADRPVDGRLGVGEVELHHLGAGPVAGVGDVDLHDQLAVARHRRRGEAGLAVGRRSCTRGRGRSRRAARCRAGRSGGGRGGGPRA